MAFKKLTFGLLVGLGATAVSLGLWLPGWLDGFEFKTWDQRVRWLARPGPHTDHIVLIKLDQGSLDWGREKHALPWPWPQSMYEYLMAFCRRQGARSVVFDVLFTEASALDASEDEALGRAVAATPGFVGAVFFGAGSGSSTQWPDLVRTQPWQKLDLDTRDRLPWVGFCTLPLAAFPIPEVATNAALLANVHANPDDDGVYRRVAPFVAFDGKLVPALGAAPTLLNAAEGDVTLAHDHLVLGGRRVPLDRRGRAILRYRGPIDVYRGYTAADVIQSEVDLQAGEPPVLAGTNLFQDCHVIFGFTAPGLYDLRTAPVSQKGVYPGMGIQATLLDNLLTGDFMRESPQPLSLLLILGLGLLGGVATIFCRNGRETVLAFVLLLPVAPVLSVGAYTQGVWLPLVAPELAVVLALVGAVLVNYATEGRQKRFIRNAFRQYLSAEVIEQLVSDPGRLKLGGEQRTLSIFFSDLQGFTSISESLTPEQLTALLNDYLTAMTDIIQGEGGTVDKYEGDAIIAFWNAPLAQEDHARRAVRAALRCQAALADLRPAFRERVGKDLFMRIGLNTGPVVVGNMGSHNRFNYTILGDAANLASRLEGINKQFDSFTLISETTRDAMNGAFPCREISRVAVVGRKTPVRVFEPMTQDVFETRRALFDSYAAALDKFYQGDFGAAAAAFEALASQDPVSAAYVRKCRGLLATPPANWQGVWVMTEK
jgi:adenylate cyclase